MIECKDTRCKFRVASDSPANLEVFDRHFAWAHWWERVPASAQR